MVTGGEPAAAGWEVVAAVWVAGAGARVAVWVQESESPSVPRARCTKPVPRQRPLSVGWMPSGEPLFVAAHTVEGPIR
jgi:hypothetical protein